MRNRTLMSLIVLAAALAPLPSLAQTREFSRTIPLEGGGELSLRTAKGSVRLTAWDRNEVQIQARIEPGRFRPFNAEDARRAVEGTTIDVEAGSRAVSIRSNYDGVPTRGGWDDDSRTIPEVHYVIQAPARIDLRLDIDRSDTELSGFDGRLAIEIDRSGFTARDLGGRIRLSIDRGGTSRLLGMRGALDLESDRTDIVIDAERLDDDSRIHADRGDIELRIAPTQPLQLRADLDRRGTFRSDFPLTVSGMRGNSVEGTLNGGGPRMTVSGDRVAVRLLRR